MPSDCLSFSETSFLSPLLQDYLSQRKELRGFYNRFPSLSAFEGQMLEKSKHYRSANRKVLVEELKDQYGELKLGQVLKDNLRLLEDPKTFTVTTGHQLNLATGPLYFLYKISSTIHLCRQLKARYPEYHFVPVYWMATEDHDFEEINFLRFHGKKIQWTRPFGGAVGRMDLKGIEEVLSELEPLLSPGRHGQRLNDLFREAYLGPKTLAGAMRTLVHALFGAYGLVILDADRAALKGLFEPYMRRELEEKISYQAVSRTNEALKKVDDRYSIQVNPRECNLFYLKLDKRYRLVEQEGRFGLQDGDRDFSKAEILKELEEFPERFSPNVLMRPLYQEVLLPNLCYIGGGGELAYWLQLRSSFRAFEVPFPMVVLRNSALLWTQKQARKWKGFGFTPKDLFLTKQGLVNQHVKRISEIPIDFSAQREFLKKQFAELHELATRTDPSFKGAVAAQETKQLNGLDKLEKRLLKAQKRKLSDEVVRIEALYEELFPQGKLQERFENFMAYYVLSEGRLVDQLVNELDPLHKGFLFISPEG